jgi:hypothetical protein
VQLKLRRLRQSIAPREYPQGFSTELSAEIQSFPKTWLSGNDVEKYEGRDAKVHEECDVKVYEES